MTAFLTFVWLSAGVLGVGLYWHRVRTGFYAAERERLTFIYQHIPKRLVFWMVLFGVLGVCLGTIRLGPELAAKSDEDDPPGGGPDDTWP